MEPTIPLKHSERLYVALSVVVQELERRTDYPTGNLHLVLHSYDSDKKKHLKTKGWRDDVIENIRSEATEELYEWFKSREEEVATDMSHLEMWEKEFGNDHS